MAQLLLVLHVHEVAVSGHRDRRLEIAGRERHRRHADDAAVAGAGDADLVGIDVVQCSSASSAALMTSCRSP